ncbi:hypothetical protein E1264_40890 [Actinomadura sp. KC216]|nr:hypothetical protein E1264_40890 [Actinomadura sp. KC216]
MPIVPTLPGRAPPRRSGPVRGSAERRKSHRIPRCSELWGPAARRRPRRRRPGWPRRTRTRPPPRHRRPPSPRIRPARYPRG